MNYKLKVKSIWEFGQRVDSQGNKHQEDSSFPEYGKQSDTDRLFIICDGMGGHDAGEIASATVCEAMSHSVLNDGHDNDGIFTEQDFNNALDAAFNALDGKDTGAIKKMGTTMTFLKLHNDGAFIAHIGDSRVYHIRPGKEPENTQILFETYDHSLVNDLVKAEVMTKEEALNSRQKNIITRAMQPRMEVRPKADIYTTSDIKAGDYFFLCTDGMIEDPDMAEGKLMKNIFSSLGGDIDTKCSIFLEATKENRDNHTAFLIYIEEVTDPIPTTNAKDTDQAPDTTNLPHKHTESNKLAIADELAIPGISSEPQSAINTDNISTTKTVDNTTSVLPPDKDTTPEPSPISSQPKKKIPRSNFGRYLLGGSILAIVLIGLFLVRTCSSNISKDHQEHQTHDITQNQTDYDHIAVCS